jgi:pilus assembly protein CpaB
MPDERVVVEAPKSKEVFVPAAELAAGTIITPGVLGRMRIEDGSITGEMIVADTEGEEFLTGSVARTYLPKGVPIARSAMVQPGTRGFLAAVLPKGKRAITIQVSEVAGMSGLVLPGDRVDIILTYSVPGSVIDADRDIRASETLLSNLRVLALDQRMETGRPLRDEEGNLITPPVARTATLQVAPDEAEMITLATQLGDLSLVLNSVRDGGEPDEIAQRAGGSILQPLGLGAASLARIDGVPRALTLDSDVTSLLQRQTAEDDASPVPPEDRTSRIQIVRGVAVRAVDLSAAATAAAIEAATRFSIPTTAPAE